MSKNLITGITIASVILIITIASILYIKSSSNNSVNVANNTTEGSKSAYKDGQYEAIGQYISPGGAEEIDVKITIQNGLIVDSTVTPKATREASAEMQSDFVDHYKPLVVGKNIDTVKLTKVSGSSLTPNGFNDALEKIKQQARS